MAKGKKTGGRKPGSINKVTATAREAFQHAFNELGGTAALVTWAKSDPDNRKVFYTLYARLIPMDVTSNGDALTLVIQAPDASAANA